MVSTNHNTIVIYLFFKSESGESNLLRPFTSRTLSRQAKSAAHLPIEQAANAAWTGTNPLAPEGCDAGKAQFLTRVGVQKCGTRLCRKSWWAQTGPALGPHSRCVRNPELGVRHPVQDWRHARQLPQRSRFRISVADYRKVKGSRPLPGNTSYKIIF